MLQICCDDRVINVDTLINDGYKKAECNIVERKDTVEYSIIEVFEPLNIRNRDILLARCYSYRDCTFISRHVENNINITCQRYVVKKVNELKKDFYNDSFKVLDDHVVLYLID